MKVLTRNDISLNKEKRKTYRIMKELSQEDDTVQESRYLYDIKVISF